MAAPTEEHVETSKTLFVRNLPYTTDEKKLEDVFSDIGPVKKCFLVKDKETGKGKGYGYVIYSILEDAIEAKNKVKKVDGRNVFIVFADQGKKKVREKKPKTDRVSNNEAKDEVEDYTPTKTPAHVAEEISDVPPIEPEDNPNQLETSLQNSKNARAKTVILTGFQGELNSGTVEEAIQNVKNVSKTIFPVKDRPTPSVILMFKCVRDSKRAVRRLTGRQFKGQTLHACQLSTEFSQGQTNVKKPHDEELPKKQKQAKELPKKQKQARLIIRNLSFKCTDEDLKTNFKKFGEVTDAVIPKRTDGRQQGFGFVEFSELSSADAAIQGMNMKQIKGRPVAVDWAVPKSAFVKESTKKTPIKPEVTSPDEGSHSAGAGEDSEEEERTENKGDNSPDEGFSDDDDDDNNKDKKHIDEDSGGSDSDESDDIGDDDDESDSESEEEQIMNKKNNQSKKRPNKLKEGQTLFIRNINFDSMEDDLQEVLGEFGEMDYCKMVMNPFTEKPKGTAFVQFKSEETAQKCLTKANEESERGGVMLDGRRLNIIVAVSRQDASRITQAGKTKEKEDKRNLYLAREGLIRPGTQAASGLTKPDLDKRLKVESVKRQKLKNPNIFISPLRLCIRNIPVKTTDKELRKIFLNAAGDKKARVTECRIMKDMTQVNAQGEAKSRGYGFVEFSDHQHALEALRKINNNPETFGEKKRPIVEFSLENKSALEAKKKRMDRLKAKQETLDKEGGKVYKDGKGKLNQNQEASGKKGSISTIKGDVPSKEKNPNEKSKKSKVMPSHWGPKVRQRDQGKQIISKKPKGRESRRNIRDQKQGKRPAPVEWKEPKMKKPKASKREKTDEFDSMVKKYRNKILSASSKPGVKWFADD